jgi:hypothetical protein
MGRTTQQIIVATGALRGRQIHQPRVLGGRTSDRDQHKHQGCGSCPYGSPNVGDFPHALSLVGISTAVLSRCPHFSEDQSTYLPHSIQPQ